MFDSLHTMNRPLKWLLWDIDGTLVRYTDVSADKHLSAVSEVVGKFCRPVYRVSGMTDMQIIKAILEENQIPATSSCFEAVRRALERLSHAEMSEEFVRPIPGVFEALELARNLGWQNGILSGNTRKRAEIKLRAAKIWPELENGPGFFGDEVANRNALVAQVPRSYEDFSPLVVAVGDTTLDIQAAKTAGLQIIAVSTGEYSLGELKQLEPDLAVNDLVDGFESFKSFLEVK